MFVVAGYRSLCSVAWFADREVLSLNKLFVPIANGIPAK